MLTMSDFIRKSATFRATGLSHGAAVSTGVGVGIRHTGRVANEVCHTKRRVNADELARIT